MLVFTVFLEEKRKIVNKIKAAHTNVFESLKKKRKIVKVLKRRRNLVAKLRK